MSILIRQNTSRLIDDIIRHLNVNNLPGALKALDFSKAFDSL